MEYNSGGAGPSHNHMMGDDGSYHLVCINCRYADDYSLEDEEDGFFSCRQCYAIHPIQVTSADPTNEFIPTNTIASRRIRTQPTIPAPNNKLRRNPAASNNRRPTQAAAAFDDDEPSEPRDFAIDDAGDGPEELASRIRLRYVCGMQLILQQQLEVLMERFHVGALICDFAGTIWLRWVHASMVFDEMWARQVLEEYEAEGRRRRIFDDNKPDEAAAGEQEDAVADDAMGEQEEDETLSGRRDRRKVEFAFLRSLRKMLPVYSTLSVSFLACHVAREAVLPTDIHKWAIEGKIPYIAAFTKVDELLEGPSSSMQGCSLDARQLFRPVRVLGPWQLETHAGSIALRIGLRLPSVNFYEIARRFCMELALPPDDRIIRHACRIYEWALPAELWLSANPAAIPTRVCVMSILIVALRILYNINGHGMWEEICEERRNASGSSASPPPFMSPDGGGNNEKFGIRELLCTLAASYDKISVGHDYMTDLQSYLKYCKDVIFTGISCSTVEEDLIEMFIDLYKGTEDVHRTEPSQCHVEEVTNSNGINKRFRDGTFVQASSFSSSLQHDALQLLKSEMLDHGFHYMPPRKPRKSDGYLRYRRRKLVGGFVYVAHADYYLLLRVFAKLAEVDVRIMHASVLKLERRLACIEERIERSLNTLQSLNDKDELRRPSE